MTKDELLALTKEVKQAKEEAERKKQEIRHQYLLDNSLKVYNTYIMNALKSSAKQGREQRIIHLYHDNLSDKIYTCIQPEYYYNNDEYYNKKLHMYYSFKLYLDGECYLDEILRLLTNDNFKYDIQHKPMASSKASQSISNHEYIALTIYWGDEEDWSVDTHSEWIVNMPVIEDNVRKIKEDLATQLFTDKDIKTDTVKKERNKLTAGLRYDILKRDGFKCQICGRTVDDGVKLHVDHIVPLSKGGKTIASNLRTLCQDCNLGKSNKLEIK